MKILFIGDIVGGPGRKAVANLLPYLIEKAGGFDAIIVNGENAAGGKGLTQSVLDEILDLEVDVITTGNHVWDNRDIFRFIDTEPNLVRPANFPKGTPGRGWLVATASSGTRIGVMNIAGQLYMDSYENPFHHLRCHPSADPGTDTLYSSRFPRRSNSGENRDGLVCGRKSECYRGHSYPRSNSRRTDSPRTVPLISRMSAWTGPHDSVIGMKKEEVIERFRTMLPRRYQVAGGDIILCGVILELDDETGKALSIQRIRLPMSDVIKGQ